MRQPVHVRRAYELERLECRYFLTIVPIDATVGVPFDGLVATNLRLPAHATGLELMNVLINNQYDYYPRAVARDDGSFDLYAKLTPQQSGTGQMVITFRNDITGGWDILETGAQTVKPAHFDTRMPNEHKYDQLPGTLMRDPVATFTKTALTRPLDEYVVAVDWNGQSHGGHLALRDDGSVGAYVDGAYLPLDTDLNVTTTVRLAAAAPDAPAVGYAETYVGGISGLSIGIGMFYGWMESDTDFHIELPKVPKYETSQFHFFRPVAEKEGWPSSFTVTLNWTHRDDSVATTTGTVTRNADGSYAVTGQIPDVTFDNAQLKIRETVQRPATGGAPAAVFTIEYVGSFELSLEKPTDAPAPVEQPPAGELPGGFEGGGMMPVDVAGLSDDSRFGAIATDDAFVTIARDFDSFGTSALDGDDTDEDEEPLGAELPAE